LNSLAAPVYRNHSAGRTEPNSLFRESWTGTEQKRRARFEGNRVYLSTPPSLDPITGTTSVRTMTWEKLG
jgi:hypothetical protein